MERTRRAGLHKEKDRPMSSLPVHPAAVPDFPEGLSEERDELSPLVTVFQVNIHLFLSNAYYLRSKMVVPFLEFDFLWEKFVNTLVNTNCTFTGKCSFHKKEFTKSCEEIGKVNKLSLPFDRKIIHKRIFSCPN